MPNGHDKNWYRLCAAINGFRRRYGRWPARIRMPAIMENDFRWLFSDRDLFKITSKVQFIVDDAGMVAEDDDGGRYDYFHEGVPESGPGFSAEDWLGVHPRPELEPPFQG